MRIVPVEHEGATLNGELYASESIGPRPGVLVMHSGLGLKQHERDVAAELAGLGYVALATDMFGADWDGEPAQAGALFQALREKPEFLRARVVAWFDHFAAMPEVDSTRVAAIGYCFGGLCVLELARSGADVKAVSSFHGLLTSSLPAQPGAIRGDVAAWCGGKDPYAPMADVEALRDEMAAAGARCQITVFGDAEHAFTDREAAALGRAGISYDAVADRVSWGGTLALLQTVLKP